jgi:hypothetical protein
MQFIYFFNIFTVIHKADEYCANVALALLIGMFIYERNNQLHGGECFLRS